MLRDLFRGSVASSYRKVFGTAGSQESFNDQFNRADGSLDPAQDGGFWTAVRGVFQVSGNKASSLTDDQYPIAAITSFTPDVDIKIKGGSGSAAALWVTDSGNWFTVGVTQTPEDCNCVAYYNSYTYTYSYEYISGYNTANCTATNSSCCAYGYVCTSYNTSNCCGYSCYGYNSSNCCGYSCYGYNAKGNCKGYYCSCYNGSNCQGYYCSCYNGSNCSGGYTTCNSYSGCNNCISYNTSNPNYATGYANATGYNGPYYNCETCYPASIRIAKSVGNTITAVTDWLVTTAVQSFSVKTSGEQITVQAFSDDSHVTQIGSDLVYTATGATIFPRFGISVNPTDYGQTFSVDGVEITPNV